MCAVFAMKRIITLFVTLMTISLSSVVHAETQYPAKNPHPGPYSQAIADIAHLKVNKNYVSFDQEDTTKLMEIMHNPGINDAWLIGPDSLEPWLALISYDPVGHVPDNDKLDSEAILDELKKGTEEMNKERKSRGWGEIHIIGWQTEPHYEADTKRLSWAVLNQGEDGKTVNYTTKILSRTGVTTVILATDTEHLDAAIKDLKQQLNGLEFNPGQKYSEFTQGDKVAEYGLTGLIVGGAAAAALKGGAWKWIVGALAASWKLIAGLGIGAAAWLKSRFKKKGD